MNYADLIKAISDSTANEWTEPINGNVLLQTPVIDDKGSSDYEGHRSVTVWKHDLAVSLAWGMSCVNLYKQPWHKNLPDSSAHSSYVDIRYHGVPVIRTTYVNVDGGRAILPQPKGQGLSVPTGYSDFIALLSELQLGGGSEYTRYFKQVGFTLEDVPWMD